MEVENMRIKSTSLGVGDTGIFTAWLDLEAQGHGQGFGGYNLGIISSSASLTSCLC